MGIGETVLDGLARKDALRCGVLNRSISDIRDSMYATEVALRPEIIDLGYAVAFNRIDIEAVVKRYSLFANLVSITSLDSLREVVNASKGVIFEGAQGNLIGESTGFHPYTTWSETTTDNVITLVDDYNIEDPFVIGVTRTYGTRHGAGPFPGENPNLHIKELHNSDDGFAGYFRRGYLHLPLLKISASFLVKIDGLAVSHTDCAPRYYIGEDDAFDDCPVVCQEDQRVFCRCALTSNPDLDDVPDCFPEFIADSLGVPLCMTSSGPTYQHREVILPKDVL
jgi:adenylosuccinate synthase